MSKEVKISELESVEARISHRLKFDEVVDGEGMFEALARIKKEEYAK